MKFEKVFGICTKYYYPDMRLEKNIITHTYDTHKKKDEMTIGHLVVQQCCSMKCTVHDQIKLRP